MLTASRKANDCTTYFYCLSSDIAANKHIDIITKGAPGMGGQIFPENADVLYNMSTGEKSFFDKENNEWKKQPGNESSGGSADSKIYKFINTGEISDSDFTKQSDNKTYVLNTNGKKIVSVTFTAETVFNNGDIEFTDSEGNTVLKFSGGGSSSASGKVAGGVTLKNVNFSGMKFIGNNGYGVTTMLLELQ